MENSWLIGLLALSLGMRLLSLRRFWRLPLRHGAGWFLSAEVGPDFYRGVGAQLLRQYRRWLLAAFVVDLLVIAALALSGKFFYVLHEQFIAIVLSVVWFNFTLMQFAYRAKALAAPSPSQPATAVQLSLATRRLRDYTNWPLEALLIGLLLGAGLLLLDWRTGFPGLIPAHVRAEARPDLGLFGTVWLLYLQVGLLLLKHLFVRVRMKLPMKRAEDYQRWREAWLTYHLRVFDATRLLCAFVLLCLAINTTTTVEPSWSLGGWLILGGSVVLATFLFYTIREQRRLAVVQREIKPIELVKEFPPTPVAEGRFLAGGLLYFNRDNPVMLARSPQGLALNLANRSTYLWLAYMAGLVLLLTWQASQ